MKPKLGIIGAPPASMAARKTSIVKADHLTEYDQLIIDPSAIVDGAAGRPQQYAFVRALSELLEQRREELAAFLQQGGVVVVFLRVPLTVQGEFDNDRVSSHELFVTPYQVNRFGFTDDTGTSRELSDDDDPMSPYLSEVESRQSTLTSGAFSEDPHAYPLAVSRAGAPIAFVEHVGPGTVYWVPPPQTADDWNRLVQALNAVWSQTRDPLADLAAEELKAITDKLDVVQAQARQEAARLRKARDVVVARILPL